MEANKEEALKAKLIAELKIEKLDYAGARRFAKKAQDMYPGLDGLDQLLKIIDVYISAEKGVNGEVNWHRVLGVSCFADKETVQKTFRKLALLLHPDKNKSVGAEGAFKLLQEAREVLCAKKVAAPATTTTTAAAAAAATTTSTNTNTSTNSTAFHDFFRRDDYDRWSTHSNAFGTPSEPWAKPAEPFITPTMPYASASGFKPRDWGATRSMPFGTPSEPCSKPAEPFVSSTVPRATGFKPRDWSATPSMPSSTSAEPFATPTVPRNLYATGIKPPASSTKPCASGTKPRASSTKTKPCEAPTVPFSVSVSNAGNSQKKHTFWTICSFCLMYFEYARKYHNHKLQCHNCQKYFIAYRVPQPKNAFKSKPFDPPQQKLSQSSMPNKPSDSGSTNAAASANEMGSQGSSTPFFSSAGVQREQIGAPNSSQAGGSSHPSRVKPRRKRYQQQEIPTKVETGHGGVAMNNDGLGSPEFSSDRERPDVRYRCDRKRDLPLVELQKMLMEKALNGLFKNLDLSSNPSVPKSAGADVKEKGLKEAVALETQVDMTGIEASLDAENMTSQMPPSDADVQDGNTDSMTVPDPDFHDFDNDRTEKAFASNQVWAAYDNDGGLPRYYAMIHSIISLKPFKMSISWLNSKRNDELAPIDWIACGFTKTSGDFRIGKHADYTSLHSFSHKVNWTKGRRGAVCIYPGKGDVWALFRNWSPDWDQHTPDEVIHEYDLVQVVDGYDEKQGVNYIPLVKVAGFKTVFRQHADKSFIRTIPREELFRFSHQVPSYLLSGGEGENAPKGCLEVDPASTPVELLQIKTEEELQREETARKCNGEGNGEVAMETSVVENAEEKEPADLMKNDPQATKWQVYARKRTKEGEAVEDVKRSRLGFT